MNNLDQITKFDTGAREMEVCIWEDMPSPSLFNWLVILLIILNIGAALYIIYSIFFKNTSG
jgi:hypothetical protein